MPRHDLFFPLKDADLREDVRTLGALVGEVIRDQGGDELFDAVEAQRLAAIARREGDPDGAVELVARTRDISPALARDLIRAFSAWFDVVNMAEKVHRIRRRRQYLIEGRAQPGGIEDAVTRLKTAGVTLQDVRQLLRRMWVEPVFTAHPTESTRRTLLRKQQKIAQLLLGRIGAARTAAETAVLLERLRMELTSGWQTAETSRERLTVADEREHALFFVAEVLYPIVPSFYEELESALQRVYGPEASALEIPDILRFGSWVGGDMDGNPDVHSKTIRETVARQQQIIVNRYFLECQALAESLSQSAARIGISAELQARIERYAMMLSAAQGLSPARHDRMPYRVFLGQVMERLRATYESRHHQYEYAAEFLDDITLIADSLRANKGTHAGLFLVRRLMRRIRTFGFHLATLDIRQSAWVHRAVVGEGFGDDGWLQRTAHERLERVRDALIRDEGPVSALDAAGKRTLWVLEALSHCRHRYGAEAIGPYLVSGTTSVDDVLSLLLLARWADTTDRRSGEVAVDVAPMFETADVLQRCGTVMTELFAEPLYRRHLAARGNHQFVMLGYAASNQENGVLGSRWLVREAQEALFTAADRAGIDLTLIYGQSSGAARGGGGAEMLIRSGPDGARRGRLRLTEQGETVNEKYGLRPIALRIFEQAFNVLSLANTGILPPERLDPRWREAMELLGRSSTDKYRALVFSSTAFHDFFRQLTPIDVIERMQIGSRPATPHAGEGIRGLRPVLWAHAWSQCRYMMPGWFGAGTALAATAEASGQVLAEMYAHWPFFTNLIDDIELALARADLAIAAHYDQLIDPDFRSFSEELRAEFALTKEQVLRLKGIARLLDGEPTLQRSIRLRSPYIDPMHMMQVDMLRRWREGGRADREIFGALVSSISGISQALQGA